MTLQINRKQIYVHTNFTYTLLFLLCTTLFKQICMIKTMHTSVTTELPVVLQHICYALAPCLYLVEQ